MQEASFKRALTKVLNEMGEEEKKEDEVTESKVGAKLTSFTTRKVIILLLVMLVLQPFQDQMTYITEPDSMA